MATRKEYEAKCRREMAALDAKSRASKRKLTQLNANARKTDAALADIKTHLDCIDLSKPQKSMRHLLKALGAARRFSKAVRQEAE